MARAKGKYSFTTICITKEQKEELVKLGAEGQPAHIVVENIINEVKRLREEEVLLPKETLERLKRRQQPKQRLDGVIETLLNYVENVEKTTGHFIDFPDIDKPQSGN